MFFCFHSWTTKKQNKLLESIYNNYPYLDHLCNNFPIENDKSRKTIFEFAYRSRA